jgi:hypothetical protein
MLARDEASFVTGNYVVVDGGRQIGPVALNMTRGPVSASAPTEG